jgi:hypothetical protein
MKPEKANVKHLKVSGKNRSSLRIRKPKSSLLGTSLSEIAAEIRRQAPKKDWEKVPTDLALNIDKYLYASTFQDKV